MFRYILFCLFLFHCNAVDVTPYLLPSDHPMTQQLDAIFSQTRVLQDKKTVREAGFATAKRQVRTHIIVTTHPQIPGYIFKFYLDKQRLSKPAEEIFINRINGVNTIRAYIEANQKEALFKTPHKWIYHKGTRFILVEEKMDILSRSDNLSHWRDDTLVTQNVLDEVYALVTTVGFHDGLKPGNLPFCQDGRIAFIDTENVGNGPVRYRMLSRHLPHSLQFYWIYLISK